MTVRFTAAIVIAAAAIWPATDRVIEVLSVETRSPSVTSALESWVATVAVRSVTEDWTEVTITD